MIWTSNNNFFRMMVAVLIGPLLPILLGLQIIQAFPVRVVGPFPASIGGASSSTSNSRIHRHRLHSVPVLDEWEVLPNGRVEGTVVNHPEAGIDDGAVISTSPVANGDQARTGGPNQLVETVSGSHYILLNPRSEATEEEELSDTQKLLIQVKDAGIAGVISYALWELGFWTVSVPVCIVAYRQVTGDWPDITNQDDLQKLGAEAFAFVNVARFAVPLRIGLALGTTPWIQKNIVDRFLNNKGDRD